MATESLLLGLENGSTIPITSSEASCAPASVLQLAFDSEGIALTSTMGFVKNPVSSAAGQWPLARACTGWGGRLLSNGAVPDWRQQGLEWV